MSLQADMIRGMELLMDLVAAVAAALMILVGCYALVAIFWDDLT